MRQFRFPVPLAVLSALLLGCGLAAPTQPRQPSFTGVTWQTPAGMKVSNAYRSNCPGRCLVYEGGAATASDDFPLIRVHEPLTGTAQAAIKTLSAWMKTERGEVVTVLKNGSETVGATVVTLALLQRADAAEDRRPDYSLFVLVERGGVTLPLELYALSDDDVSGPRLAVIAGLADTVKLDPTAIQKDLAFRTQRFANLQKAVADGYAKGERARVFMFSSTRVENVYNFATGLTLRTVQDVELAAFLPGGVFLDTGPEPDYRTPDLRRMGGGELPATWKAVSGGFQVTQPGGKTMLYALGKGGSQPTVRADGVTYFEAAPLKAADLVGVFTTVRTSTSGVGDNAIYSRSDQDLELLAGGPSGGQYRSSNSSFTSFTSAAAVGSSGNKSAPGGTWSYDPASLTLTLKSGGRVRSGPTYTTTYTAAGRQQKSVDWTVLGQHDWWKAK